MTKPLLRRCSWCKLRIGHSSWINERGQIIQLPKWVVVEDHDITDGLCIQCLSEQIVLAEQTNAQYRARKEAVV